MVVRPSNSSRTASRDPQVNFQLAAMVSFDYYEDITKQNVVS